MFSTSERHARNVIEITQEAVATAGRGAQCVEQPRDFMFCVGQIRDVRPSVRPCVRGLHISRTAEPILITFSPINCILDVVVHLIFFLNFKFNFFYNKKIYIIFL